MAAFVLKCPACEKKFKYDVSDGWPDFCPLCAHKMGNDRPDDEIVMPAFLSPKTRNNDAVARQIMDGSETRMHLAAATAGVPVSEMSNLKITDINDRKDSEIAHVQVVNPVTQHMAAMNHNPWQGTVGMSAATDAHNGPEPYAGARMRTALQNIHAKNSVTSDRPALETQQPGYRRRG